jgi:hypothetical protein
VVSVPRPELTYRNPPQKHSWLNGGMTAQRMDSTHPLYLKVTMMTSFVAAREDDIALRSSSVGGELVLTGANALLPATLTCRIQCFADGCLPSKQSGRPGHSEEGNPSQSAAGTRGFPVLALFAESLTRSFPGSLFAGGPIEPA